MIDVYDRNIPFSFLPHIIISSHTSSKQYLHIEYFIESASSLHDEIRSILSELSSLGHSYITNSTYLNYSISQTIRSTSDLSQRLYSLYDSLVSLQHVSVNVSADIDSLTEHVGQSVKLESQLRIEANHSVHYWSSYWQGSRFDLHRELRLAVQLLQNFEGKSSFLFTVLFC